MTVVGVLVCGTVPRAPHLPLLLGGACCSVMAEAACQVWWAGDHSGGALAGVGGLSTVRSQGTMGVGQGVLTQ